MLRFTSSSCSLKLAFGAMVAAVSIGVARSATGSGLAEKLRAEYPLTKVGIAMLKFDYNRITEPGIVLTVRIPGIYADVAGTPQAIVNTTIDRGQAVQQKGFLASLSNTTQSRVLNVNEPVYVTRLDLKRDAVHLELLTVNVTTLGTGAGTRYRAEVNFHVPNLDTASPDTVKSAIDSALSSSTSAPPAPGGTLQPVAAPATGVAPAPGAPATRGLAQITPEQSAKIVTLLDHAPATLKPQVDAARDILVPYLSTMACVNDYGTYAARLRTYLGPHGVVAQPPFNGLKYHDANSCLDITRLQGWKALSLNAFEFQAVYTAADSGESSVRRHEVQREPDGTWLMNE